MPQMELSGGSDEDITAHCSAHGCRWWDYWILTTLDELTGVWERHLKEAHPDEQG